MPADLLAGCCGTEWNPKGPVALVTDYRCCSKGMWRDPMVPDGRPLGLLITQRSRVQIPPPPPTTTRAFATSGGRPSGVPRAECSRLAHVRRRRAVAKDQASHRLGRLRVQARQHMRVSIERDLNRGMAQALTDDLGRDTGRQCRARVAVAHIMQADLRKPRVASQPLEPVGDEV